MSGQAARGVRVEGDPHACITASCLTHRRGAFWQSSERRWVHHDCRPCEPGQIKPVPRGPAKCEHRCMTGRDCGGCGCEGCGYGPPDWLEMGAAAFDTAAPQVQESLFGAELPGPGQLAGQGSLFAGGE